MSRTIDYRNSGVELIVHHGGLAAPFNDQDVDCGTGYVLLYMLTRPRLKGGANWVLRVGDLVTRLGICRNTAFARLRKLKDLGYLWHEEGPELHVAAVPKNGTAAVPKNGIPKNGTHSKEERVGRAKADAPGSLPGPSNEEEEERADAKPSSSSDEQEQEQEQDAPLSTEEASLSTRWLKKELLANSTQVHHIVVELGCPVDYLDETKFKAQQEAGGGQRWQGLLLSMVEAYDVDQWAMEHGKIIAARMKNLIWWNWPPVRRLIEADPALLATWEEWLLKMADGGCRVRRLFLKGGWDAVEYGYRELYQFGQYFKSIHGNGEFKPQALAAGG